MSVYFTERKSIIIADTFTYEEIVVLQSPSAANLSSTKAAVFSR